MPPKERQTERRGSETQPYRTNLRSMQGGIAACRRKNIIPNILTGNRSRGGFLPREYKDHLEFPLEISVLLCGELIRSDLLRR
jgi:hypothetical protein